MLAGNFQAVERTNMETEISDVYWEGGATMSGCLGEVPQQVTFKQRLERIGTLQQKEELFLKDKNRPAWLECSGPGDCEMGREVGRGWIVFQRATEHTWKTRGCSKRVSESHTLCGRLYL